MLHSLQNALGRTWGSRALARTTAVTALVLVAIACFAVGVAGAFSTPNTALIDEESVSTNDNIVKVNTNPSEPISLEQFAAEEAGFSVKVVPGSVWENMSQAEFSQYQVLIVGAPSGSPRECKETPASANKSAAIWAPVVMGTAGGNPTGNRVVVGADPEDHYYGGNGNAQPTNQVNHHTYPTTTSDPTTSGAEHLVQDGIAYAGAAEGATGIYYDTGCKLGPGGSDLNTLDLLTIYPTEPWTARELLNPHSEGGELVQQIATANAFDAGPTKLEDTDIEKWEVSSHVVFPTFPDDWAPLAVVTDTVHTVCGTDPHTQALACGEPYVLIAGKGISDESELTLTPATHSDLAGGSHTVTATLTSGSTPTSNVVVTFAVTGQNAGAAGTCTTTTGAADPTCDTDSTGAVQFTYQDGNGVGADSINASVTVDGVIEHAVAAETWFGEAPRWYSNGELIPEGKPENVKTSGHLTFTRVSGGEAEVACRINDDETVVNPTAEAAGLDSLTSLSFSACTIPANGPNAPICGVAHPVVRALNLPWQSTLSGHSPKIDVVSGVEIEIKCPNNSFHETFKGTLEPTMSGTTAHFTTNTGTLSGDFPDDSGVIGEDTYTGPKGDEEVTTSPPPPPPSWYSNGKLLTPELEVLVASSGTLTFTYPSLAPGAPLETLRCKVNDSEGIFNRNGLPGVDETLGFSLSACAVVGAPACIGAHTVTALDLPWHSELKAGTPERDAFANAELLVRCQTLVGTRQLRFSGPVSPTVGSGKLQFDAAAGELQTRFLGRAKMQISGTDGLRGPPGDQTVGVTSNPKHQETGDEETPHTSAYLALGDSLAFGYSQDRFELNYPTENPLNFEEGYVNHFSASLQKTNTGLEVINLGCPGETSAGLIGEDETLGGGSGPEFEPCPYQNSHGLTLHRSLADLSQLEAALNILNEGDPKQQVKAITLDVGLSDEIATFAQCEREVGEELEREGKSQFGDNPESADVACITVKLQQVTIPSIIRNLKAIVGALDSTSPHGGRYTGPIIVLGLYNPYFAQMPGSDELQTLVDRTIEQQVLPLFPNASFANPFPVFNKGKNATQEQASICKYTEMCSIYEEEGAGSTARQDIDPSAAGYAELAKLVEAAFAKNPAK